MDNVVTDSGTKPLSARQGKKLEENKQNKNDSTLLTVAKTIVGAINELFNNKLEKGGYSGNAKNLNDELSKKASKSILGRMIVGDNLTVDSNGRVSANSPVDISGKLDKGGLPAKISDAKGLYDLIENNSGLNFDTALLFLNDSGTKYVNKIYFDRNKKGMFKCISQTTATTNSTSYFVDISNEANADQLRNLKRTVGASLFLQTLYCGGGFKFISTSEYKYCNEITNNNDGFTILEDGIYLVNHSAFTTFYPGSAFNISINNSVYINNTLDNPDGSNRTFPTTALISLKKGDKIQFRLWSYQATTFKNISISILKV